MQAGIVSRREQIRSDQMQVKTMRAVREMGQSYSARDRVKKKTGLGPRCSACACGRCSVVLQSGGGCTSSKTPTEAMLGCLGCPPATGLWANCGVFTVGIRAAGSCNCMSCPYRLYTASPPLPPLRPILPHPNNHRRARQGLHASQTCIRPAAVAACRGPWYVGQRTPDCVLHLASVQSCRDRGHDALFGGVLDPHPGPPTTESAHGSRFDRAAGGARRAPCLPADWPTHPRRPNVMHMESTWSALAQLPAYIHTHTHMTAMSDI